MSINWFIATAWAAPPGGVIKSVCDAPAGCGNAFQCGLAYAKTCIIDRGGLSQKTDPASVVLLIFGILQFVLAFMAVFAVAVVIFAGFRYITSFGNEKKTEGAKKMILYAVIGLAIIGLSVTLVNFVIANVK